MNEEKLPSFLCIGSPKCGSSWLHDLLASHPHVFIPPQIKEIHYFDKKFDRGKNWYLSLFSEMTSQHKIAGEITPHYLYSDPQRIHDFPSITRFILIYRDPVERIVSHYKFRIRLDNYSGSFEQFLDDYPESIEWSRYGKHFANYLQQFKREQFLVLRFEKATADVASTRLQLSQFLGINADSFPSDSGKQIVNAAFNPKNRRLYRFAIRVAKWMGDSGLFRIRNWLKNSSFAHKILFRDGGEFQVKISDATLKKLTKDLADDTRLFENLIQEKTAGSNTH